jgi:proteasome lid subunit RPN8/RPN11
MTPRTSIARALLALAAAGAGVSAVTGRAQPEPAIVLTRAVRDSMGAVFRTFNRNWDQLADLNTMEKMLGTIRPTQREYLGCLIGRVKEGTVYVERWVPAREMKQLQLAVAGSCDSVPAVVGTWHTHPYRADLNNLPVKERALSAQDLETFAESHWAATVVMWDEDSLDAAARAPDGRPAHPVAVRIE